MKIHFLSLSASEDFSRGLEVNLRSYDPDVSLLSLTGAKSITSGYNTLERMLSAPELDEILCFIHHDVRLHFDFARLMPLYFQHLACREHLLFKDGAIAGIEERPVGVIGVFGSTEVTLDLAWWAHGTLFGAVAVSDNPNNPTPNLVRSSPRNAFFGETQGVDLWYHPVDVLDGMCMFVRRDVFRALGGFDESFDDWHFYDVDICLSALYAGYQNYVVAQPSQHLVHAGNLDRWGIQHTKYAAKWRQRLGGSE